MDRKESSGENVMVCVAPALQAREDTVESSEKLHSIFVNRDRPWHLLGTCWRTRRKRLQYGGPLFRYRTADRSGVCSAGFKFMGKEFTRYVRYDSLEHPASKWIMIVVVDGLVKIAGYGHYYQSSGLYAGYDDCDKVILGPKWSGIVKAANGLGASIFVEL